MDESKTKLSEGGKKFSDKEIAAAIAIWDQAQQRQSQTISSMMPSSMIGTLPPPPTQFPDCMQLWMQAYGTASRIDQNNIQIYTLQVQNGNMLVTLGQQITAISSCVASHQV